MEHNQIDDKAVRNAKIFSIISGIAAISVIAWRGYYYISTYNRSLRWAPISLHIEVIAMIVCAIYMFAFYNRRRSPLLGISAALIACLKVSDFMRLLTATSYTSNRFYEVDSTIEKLLFLRDNVFYPIATIIIGLAFAAIALRYLSSNANKKNVKWFPIIAFSVAVASRLIFTFLTVAMYSKLSYYYFNLGSFVTGLLYDCLYIVPFLLFALFCPLKKEETYRVNVLTQVAKVLIAAGIVLCILQVLSMIGNARSQNPYSSLYRSLMGSMYGASYYFGYYLGRYWSGIAGIILLIVGRKLYKRFKQYAEDNFQPNAAQPPTTQQPPLTDDPSEDVSHLDKTVGQWDGSDVP